MESKVVAKKVAPEGLELISALLKAGVDRLGNFRRSDLDSMCRNWLRRIDGRMYVGYDLAIGGDHE